MRIHLAKVMVVVVTHLDGSPAPDVASDVASDVTTDGRVARRERNIAAVLDAVVEVFTEGEPFPSIEQIAGRTGLSLRSVYRYFPDPASMHDAAIRRHREQTEPLAAVPNLGEGPLVRRIEDFVEVRLRLHEHIGATFRATVYGASRSPRLRDELAEGRNRMRAQFEAQFAPELDALGASERAALAAAGDALTQLDSIDLLRHHRALTAGQAGDALRAGLERLLGGIS